MNTRTQTSAAELLIVLPPPSQTIAVAHFLHTIVLELMTFSEPEKTRSELMVI